MEHAAESLKAQGFVVGATIRQHCILTPGRFYDAKVLRVPDGGALDVDCRGSRQAWNASYCDVIAAPDDGPHFALDADGNLHLIGSACRTAVENRIGG